MKLKTGFAVVLLTLIPNLTFAMGCARGNDDMSASSCAVGMVWDALKETCVTPANS